MISAVCQTPLVIIAFFGMRQEFVKVLAGTFDFCFLSAMGTIMTVVFGVALGGTFRLATIPFMWLDIFIGLLTESYLNIRPVYALASVTMCVSMIILMAGVSLDLTLGLNHQDAVVQDFFSSISSRRTAEYARNHGRLFLAAGIFDDAQWEETRNTKHACTIRSRAFSPAMVAT